MALCARYAIVPAGTIVVDAQRALFTLPAPRRHPAETRRGAATAVVLEALRVVADFARFTRAADRDTGATQVYSAAAGGAVSHPYIARCWCRCLESKRDEQKDARLLRLM